jgi:hypothetical protein
VPPAPCQDDTFGDDLAVAFQVLADNIDVVEATLLDGQDRRIPTLPGLRLPSSRRFRAMAAFTSRRR